MTIWAVIALAVMMAARLVGMTPAAWPGARLIAGLLGLLLY